VSIPRRRLVLHLRHMLWIGDRNAAARRRPCRILPRHQESARAEMRTSTTETICCADLNSRSENKPGPVDADLPLRPDKIAEKFPKLLRAVSREGRRSCGPAIRCTQ